MAINGVDPAAKSPGRIRRNWNRTIKGAVTPTLSTVLPVTLDSQNRLTLNIASNGGIDNTLGAALKLKLADTTLAVSTSGVKVNLATNPGLTVSSGLKILVDPAGALSLSSSGVGIATDGSTIEISSNQIRVKDGGISLPKLSALTTKGDLLGYTTTHARIPVGSDGQVLTADSTQAAGVKWSTPSSLTSPLTTKGDIWVYSTTNARLPVGTDGQVLIADSLQPTGLRWGTVTGGGGGTTSPLTTKGDIWIYTNADARLPIGSDGSFLVADSTQAAGMKWLSTPIVGLAFPLNFTDTTGGYVMPLSAVATASAGAAANAIDRNSNTTWSLGHSINTATDFFQIDLGKTLALGGIVAELNSNGVWPAAGSITGGLSTSSMSTLASWVGQPAGTSQGFSTIIQEVGTTPNGRWSLNWSPTAVRYVRVVPGAACFSNAVNFWQISELYFLDTNSSVGQVQFWPAIGTIVPTANQTIHLRALIKKSFQFDIEVCGLRIGTDTNNWYGLLQGNGSSVIQRCAGGVTAALSSLNATDASNNPWLLDFIIGVQENADDQNWFAANSKASASPNPTIPQYVLDGSLTLLGKTLTIWAYTDSPNLRLRGANCELGTV